MIKALTPYYVEVPFVSPLTGLTCTSFTLRLYIWNGDKSTPPTTPTYERTKENPTGATDNVKLNIARYINDFIDFTATLTTDTEPLNGNNQQWVKWDVIYKTSNPLDYTTPSNVNTKIFVKGYGYGMEGENPQTPTNKILIPVLDYNVSTNSIFVIPVQIDETEIVLGTLTIDDITNISGDSYELEFTQTGNLDFKYYRYKLSTDSDWILGDESSDTSPFTITLPTIAGTYNVQLFAYDNDNAVNVYSNIFNVIVT